MTCIIITFNPFRKIELKFTSDPSLVEEKNCLKRALDKDKSPSSEKEEFILAAAKKMKPDSMLSEEENVTVK